MRPSLNLISLLLLIGFILTSCNNKKAENHEVTEFDINAAKTEIQEKTKQFTKAHILKDTVYLNNSFTDDAKVFPPNSEVVIGKKAISKLNYDWVNYGIYEFKEESTSLYGSKDYIIDEGTYYLRYGKENTIDKGKYINVWKNSNGEWKIYSNIWNTNLPIETLKLK
ncbi:YybH family protein [Flavobacterium sp. RSB2_4_14]|uniref:YybH family protein n=1 Tax=Flavobacterium sp. RSB2_4_14 TaxID=3447665 RepID=UPI003F403479